MMDWGNVKRGDAFVCSVDDTVGVFLCWSIATEGPCGDTNRPLAVLMGKDYEGGVSHCAREYLIRSPEHDVVVIHPGETQTLEQMLARVPEGEGYMLVFFPANPRLIIDAHYLFEIIKADKTAKNRVVRERGDTPIEAIRAALLKMEAG